jgi:hypothetical protein
VKHDWRELFTKLGLLPHCETIAWMTRQLGLFSMLFGIIFGAWLLYLMATLPVKKRSIATGI